MPFRSLGSRRRALRKCKVLIKDVGARRVAWSRFLVCKLLLVCLVVAQGCENDYPIAPTACDDWCHATQRADCKEDEAPDDCVSTCEATALGRRFPRCEPEWIAVTDCYLQAPDSDFVCVGGYSQPLDSVCLEARRQANYCVSEHTGLCFDHCVREVELCGGSLTDCEWNCASSTPGCDSEQLELDRCLSAAPIVCMEDGSAESVDDIQCCEPWVELLDCFGYEGPACP